VVRVKGFHAITAALLMADQAEPVFPMQPDGRITSHPVGARAPAP
jgi:hypothetical protein